MLRSIRATFIFIEKSVYKTRSIRATFIFIEKSVYKITIRFSVLCSFMVIIDFPPLTCKNNETRLNGRVKIN